MLEMFSTRLELLLLAFYSSINWIPLPSPEDLLKVMPEGLEIELSISY
jgi:hypothetical protein